MNNQILKSFFQNHFHTGYHALGVESCWDVSEKFNSPKNADITAKAIAKTKTMKVNCEDEVLFGKFL